MVKDNLLRSWANCRGWRCTRPLLLFESDDWGAVRMPGRLEFEKLAETGIDVHTCPYDRIDTLEGKDDLEALFNLLTHHRSSTGLSPRFTFNAVLGNPDFDAIRDSGFEHFFHEDLFESYCHYHGEDLRAVWAQAMDEKLIRPQFHGREHLNVGLWLKDLKAGRLETKMAFNSNYYGHTTRTSSPRQSNYLAAFWPQSQSHFDEIKDIVEDGLNLFEKLFGYRSRSFIPCNYVLPEALEAETASFGIELIQGQRGQLQPSADGSSVSKRRSYTGQRNKHGQLFSVRNVKFEPFEDLSHDWVASALKEIKSAFFWGTPAIISTHRANYVSGMDLKNRDRNLRLLDTLLRKILVAWPDVEFVSSDDLIPMMAD